MAMDIILVKNMVCRRCVNSVETILTRLSIPVYKVLFGEIHLTHELSGDQKGKLAVGLSNEGFELIDSHMSGLIEKIKMLVIQRARNEVDKNDMKLTLSAYLSEKLHYEYTHLSSSFSSVEGRTIENFYILHRIERAKELLVYGQMTLSEIAFELDYSSTAYLSTQFKKITGMTPTYFREVGKSKRKELDLV